jgi:hypothetical protein
VICKTFTHPAAIDHYTVLAASSSFRRPSSAAAALPEEEQQTNRTASIIGSRRQIKLWEQMAGGVPNLRHAVEVSAAPSLAMGSRYNFSKLKLLSEAHLKPTDWISERC